MAAANSFDMTRAWEEATALLRANRQTVLVVAGVFFFLPYLAISLLIPDLGAAMGGSPAAADPEQAAEAAMAAFAQNWWAILLVAILQAIGSLALLAMFGRAGRPMLGDALRDGLAGLLTYIAANLLVAIALVAALALLLTLAGATGSSALAAVALGLAFATAVYVSIKISLMSPAIAVEGMRNPIEVVRRSWRLTKGNSARLLVFYVLLIAVYIVLSLILSLVTGLVGALFGETFDLWRAAIVGALVNAAMVTVLLGVVAAIHRQLSGHATRASVPKVGGGN